MSKFNANYMKSATQTKTNRLFIVHSYCPYQSSSLASPPPVTRFTRQIQAIPHRVSSALSSISPI